MVAMETIEFTYCPHCATRLARRLRFGSVRPVCPACNFVHFLDPKVAVIAFITHGARLLLIQRAVSPAKGLWALPGGYMDAGEMPPAALRRELREEVGLEIEVGELIDIFPMAGSGATRQTTQSAAAKNPGIVLAYQAVPKLDHPTADGRPVAVQPNDDVSAAGWFAPDELPAEIAFASTRRLLAAWQARYER